MALESSDQSFAGTDDQDKFPVVRVTLEALVLVALLGVAAFLYLRQGKTEEVAQTTPPSFPPATEEVLIPTLSLEAIEEPRADFSAALIGQQNGVNIHYFTAAEATSGFTAPADEHVLFDCPATLTAAIEVDVAHGNRALWKSVRYWGYEYSGNEQTNQAAGKTGRALFDGRFWLSQGELNETAALYGYLNTVDPDSSLMDMVGGKRYYLMVDGATLGALPFYVSCLDSDGDQLNDGAENGLGIDRNDQDSDDDMVLDGLEVQGYEPWGSTNPASADTDEDGIQDGTEMGFTDNSSPDTDQTVAVQDADPTTTTDPANPDTDGGGLTDGQEDVNFNGMVDEGEKDPLNAADDSDSCGNGVINALEDCDDGNAVANDGCSPACTQEEGWVCLAMAGGSGLSECRTICGDGLIRGEEECDDGDLDPGNGCSATCTVEDLYTCTGEPSVCEIPIPVLSERLLGDVNNDELIDAADLTLIKTHIDGGAQIAAADFSYADVQQDETITKADYYLVLGLINGVITLPELYGDVEKDALVDPMDAQRILQYLEGLTTLTPRQIYVGDVNIDGAVTESDKRIILEYTVGTLNTLPQTCGNGIIENGTSETPDWGEKCDDGNSADGDGCSMACQIETVACVFDADCAQTNECCLPDDDNIPSCQPCPVCGNGILETVEECDDGNNVDGDGCSAMCMLEAASCGNGTVDSGEQCDDGNIVSGDGCSDACIIEAGWACGMQPSICNDCGNGRIDNALLESCDDGNEDAGDGCSAVCRLEDGYTCTGTPSVCHN